VPFGKISIGSGGGKCLFGTNHRFTCQSRVVLSGQQMRLPFS
jgi:hypothetical protein